LHVENVVTHSSRVKNPKNNIIHFDIIDG
jgi:hypothetical protein